MSERDQRGLVVKALRELDAMSVENRVYPGTPDVAYIGGWIELKWLRAWPKRADFGPVHIDHFTAQQRVWLKRHWRKGGRSFLLLQAHQQDWLLFDGETAAQAVGRVSRAELFNRALMIWKGFNGKELKQWVTTPWADLQTAKNSSQFVADLVSAKLPEQGN